MALGQSVATNSLQNMQVLTKGGQWVITSQSDFFNKLYTPDRYDHTMSQHLLHEWVLMPDPKYRVLLDQIPSTD